MSKTNALTICQPYAELIMLGEKRVENRSWSTKYRGKLLIHAGKSEVWISQYEREHGPSPENMTFGAILGTVDLVECLKLTAIGPRHAYAWVGSHLHASGPWCWVLQNPVRFERPIPYRGQQGLFLIPNECVPECEGV